MCAQTARDGAIAILAGLALSWGCAEELTPAVGPNAHVTVFADLSRDDPALRPLVESLEREVYTTQSEEAFSVEISPAERFGHGRRWKNLILLACLDRPGPWPELIRRVTGGTVFGEFERGVRPYAAYSDVWAVGQTVIILAAPDSAALKANILRYAAALYDTLETRAGAALRRSLYARGEQAEVSRRLRRERGWSLRIPVGCDVEDDRSRSMVTFHLPAPERWVFVQTSAMPPQGFTAEECLRRRLGSPRLYQDEEWVIGELRTREARFAGRRAFVFEGRWQTPSFVVGGPFRAYAVHAGDTMYLVELAVFLPGRSKLPYLRQLDAMAGTFTLSDVE